MLKALTSGQPTVGPPQHFVNIRTFSGVCLYQNLKIFRNGFMSNNNPIFYDTGYRAAAFCHNGADIQTLEHACCDMRHR